MPNYADISYVVRGGEDDITKLSDALMGLFDETDYCEGGHPVRGLLERLGDTQGDDPRGYVMDYSVESDIVRFDMKWAWWHDEDFMWRLEEVLPDSVVYYRGSEPGFEIFSTNDDCGDVFPELHRLDTPSGRELFQTLGEVAVRLSEITGESVVPEARLIRAAVKRHNESCDDGSCINFNEYKCDGDE